MNWVFADTLYWNAKLLSNDPWRAASQTAFARLPKGTMLVTTEEVLVEVLSTFSKLGVYCRKNATD